MTLQEKINIIRSERDMLQEEFNYKFHDDPKEASKILPAIKALEFALHVLARTDNSPAMVWSL